MWRAELPGSRAQHPMDKVSHSEEKKHNKNPRKFPGDHGDVVISLVHELLATGDGSGVVPLRAADLVIPTKVLSTFSDGMNNCAIKKENREHRQHLASVEQHHRFVHGREMILLNHVGNAWETGCRRD